jgi:hypothetical protein
MAKNDVTTCGDDYASGVTVKNGPLGRLFCGEREPLIDAGIAKSEWFPGEPGQRKTVGRGWRGNQQVTIRCLRRKKRFAILVEFTEEEKKAKFLHRHTDQALRFETPEDYREWLISTVDAYRKLVPLGAKQTQSGHTCTIAFESTTAIEDALADLYWAYRNAVIHPPPRVG